MLCALPPEECCDTHIKSSEGETSTLLLLLAHGLPFLMRILQQTLFRNALIEAETYQSDVSAFAIFTLAATHIYELYML